MRNALKILVGEVQTKRPLEGPRYRWEGNITETDCEAVNSIKETTQDGVK